MPSYRGTPYKNLGNRLAIVGQTFSTIKQVKAWFTYENTSSSTIGVGLSINNPVGGYKADGTIEATGGWSSGGKASFPQQSGAKSIYYKTTFEYAIYTWVEPSPCGGFNDYYQTDNLGWTEGSAVTQVARAPYVAKNYCSVETAGETIETQKSTSLTWANGVDIGTLIGGFNMSIQTGYTQDSYTDYRWSSHPNNRLCGVNNYPGLSGSLINVAR